jgi:cyclic pyranopterin phosphate synthase
MDNGILTDSTGRVVKYFRVSVTDRCNYRCKYCVPQGSFVFNSHENTLRYEDILFAVEIMAKMGVEKVRVTGGEPLVRKNLPYFLAQLSSISGIKDAALTTNASLLSGQAEEIYKAGVRRLNISLDTLDKERFSYITGGGDIEKVFSGIDKAVKVGFAPIKLNAVIIKGFNDQEILPLCKFAHDNGLILRFIEFMPIGNSSGWNKDDIFTGKDILDAIRKEYEVSEASKVEGAGPARHYTLSNGARIGLITPISDHFCSECDKLRLTSDGLLRPCLLSDVEIPAADALKKHDEDLFMESVHKALSVKKKSPLIGYELKKSFSRTMSRIGG